MPHFNYETNMSEPNEADDVALQTVVLAFLTLFPKPTDDQTHALAGLLGLDFLEFEDQVRHALTPYLAEDEDPAKVSHKDVDYEVDNELDDPKDTFLLAFYMMHPEPTQEQLLILSVLADLTLEELEEHTYRVINLLLETHPQGVDVDFDSLDLDTDFEGDEDLDADLIDDDDDTLTDGDGDTIQLL